MEAVRGLGHEGIIIAPSLICLDLLNLERDINILEGAGVKALHVDILDGYFSPSMPIGLDTVKQLKKQSRLIFDCHVMAVQNEFFVNSLLDMGVEQITFHAETEPHTDGMLNRIKAAGARAGVALKPGTPVDVLEYVIEKCDTVLLMLINPGFAFFKSEAQVKYAGRKLADLNQLITRYNLNTTVEVDGRISKQNVEEWGGRLASVFVGGSTLLDTSNLLKSARALTLLESKKAE